MPDDPPPRICPACGKENFPFAVRCLECTAELDPSPRTEPVPVRMQFDDGLESEARYGKLDAWRPKWAGRFESPLNHVARFAGICGLIAITSQSYIWGDQVWWPILLLFGLTYVVLRARDFLRAKKREGQVPNNVSVAGSMDILVRGLGCVIILAVTVFGLFFVICMAFFIGR